MRCKKNEKKTLDLTKFLLKCYDYHVGFKLPGGTRCKFCQSLYCHKKNSYIFINEEKEKRNGKEHLLKRDGRMTSNSVFKWIKGLCGSPLFILFTFTFPVTHIYNIKIHKTYRLATQPKSEWAYCIEIRLMKQTLCKLSKIFLLKLLNQPHSL